MTQREKVLRMLKDAGPKGVRSDEFFKAHMPRAGARVYELRAEGHEIASEHEKQFVRYRLQPSSHEGASLSPTVTSGEYSREESAAESPGGLRVRGLERSVPPMFDYDADWAA